VEILDYQRHARQPFPKKPKKPKIKWFDKAWTPPFFFQNAPKKGSFLLSVRFLEGVPGRLGVDGEELTQFPKNGLFAEESQKNGVRNIKPEIFLTPCF
jgi:hypothetical protein